LACSAESRAVLPAAVTFVARIVDHSMSDAAVVAGSRGASIARRAAGPSRGRMLRVTIVDIGHRRSIQQISARRDANEAEYLVRRDWPATRPRRSSS